MRPYPLTTYFKNFPTTTKQISLELCTNRKLDIQKVKEIDSPFCSVTWLDNEIVKITEHPAVRLSRELIENDINVVMHLPGRIYNKDEMLDILNTIKDIGVRNILALQGEKSLGLSKSDFPYAYNLVRFIKENFADYFCIGVTGYPSGHPHSPDLDEDMLRLKQKVDAGADFIITQAVFDIDTSRNFYRRCRNLEINVPILPGLFIISDFSSLMNMVKFCKLQLPDDIMKFIERHKDNKEIVEEYGISSVVDMAKNFLNNKDLSVHCVHIFTLNDLDIVQKVLKHLDLDV